MNSILHNCSHKDSDVTHAFREEEVFVAIFNYIEHVFSLIQPKKIFFMAIDGVAPRAKMNQQRSRRFRSALDAEKARADAIKKGIDLPETEPFDSNAITPGTEFMAKLTEQLKYFINRKVSEDSQWQGIEVILSGHEVPGEGEHKIQEFIRSERAKPEFSVNTRHCLYGLDADLIMLGLLSHDPHFSLLREEVTFGRQRSAKRVELTEQRFFLLHLSLVREYLEIDLSTELDKMSFEFDFDRALDDWILINFFIGNDFLPELPSLLINEGAMPIVMRTYKMYLTSADGYMTENGLINQERLGIWLDLLSKFEFEKFEEMGLDVEWFNEDLTSVSLANEHEEAAKLKISSREKHVIRQLKPIILKLNRQGDANTAVSIDITDDDKKFVQHIAQRTWTRIIRNEDGTYEILLDADGILESPDRDDDDDDEDSTSREAFVHQFLRRYENAEILDRDEEEHKKQVYSEKYDEWRNSYYKSKFGITIHNEDAITDIAQNYVEGLQWVLYYYYQGVASWGWFYRYHYGPRITDVKKGLGKAIKFDVGHPFRPFQQLMSVLPDRSRKLVPAPYRELMTEPSSPIIDFYPREFKLDMNGKKNDWEAVVKIPFVDEKRLLSTLATVEDRLSPEEKKRNSYGSNIRFIFNPQVDFIYPSSLPGHLLDIPNCHCVEVQFQIPHVGPSELKFGLLSGAKLGKEALAGFPSLKTLNFTASIALAGAVVFQSPSRNESVVLEIQSSFASDSAIIIAEKLIGENVYVGWPYLTEAKVCAVSDDQFRYEKYRGEVNNTPHEGAYGPQDWLKISRRIEEDYKRHAVRIGTVNIIVHAKLIKGLTRDENGAFIKEFDENKAVDVAVQTIVEEVIEEDERTKERPPLPVDEEFPLGTRALFLAPQGYGNPVTIKGHENQKLDIELLKLKDGEPPIGSRLAQKEFNETRFLPSYVASKQLGIDPLFLSKITSKFFVTVNKQKSNIGLEMKLDAQRQRIIGYTRRGVKVWEFTPRALDLIRNYLRAFAPIFQRLSASKAFTPDMDSIFPDVPPIELKASIDKMRQWLRDYKEKNPEYELVSLETEALSKHSVKMIEIYIRDYAKREQATENLVMRGVPREKLLAPTYAYHELRSQKFSLGDRVVYALTSGKVQLYSRGTVVGIHTINYARVDLDVVFDHTFEAGNTLSGRCEDKRGLTVDSGSFINLTNRQLVSQKDTNGKKGPMQKTSTMPHTLRSTPNQKITANRPTNNLRTAKQPAQPAWSSKPSVSAATIGPQATQAAVRSKKPTNVKANQKRQGPAQTPAQGQTQAQIKIQTHEADAKDILAMIKPKKRTDEEIKQANENLLTNFGQDREQQKSASQKRLLHMLNQGAAYQQQPPIPPSAGPMLGPGPGMVPMPGPAPIIIGPGPGMAPMPGPPPANGPPFFAPPPEPSSHPDNDSAALMSMLNIGQPQNGASQSASRGRGRGRGRGGRGNGRGRGRGGRGRGNGSGNGQE